MPRGLFKIPTNKVSFSDAEAVLELTDGPNSEGWYHGRCLKGDVKIKTNKGWVEIQHIVANKLPLYAQTLLPDDTIGWRPITGYFKNKRDGRKLVKITREHPPQSHKKELIVTEDHIVLTTSGWVTAKKLIKTPMKIITGEEAPTYLMKKMIDGTLLGDASIPRIAQRLRFSQINQEYVRLKQWSLGLMHPHGNVGKNRGFNGKGLAQDICSVYFPVRVWSKQQRKRWYPEGKKIVPKDLELTNLTLATWYMDDGCLVKRKSPKHKPNVVFSTNGFLHKDVLFLSELLKEKNIYNVVDRKTMYKKTKYENTYSTIRVLVQGAEELFQRISKYLPPSMRYKLPENSPPFDINAWNFGKPITSWDFAWGEYVEPLHHHYARNKDYPVSFVYDIEIKETHNFITPFGVVHNCPCDYHEDENPSFAVKEADDGSLIVHCFASCEPKDIYKAIRTLLNEE